MSSIIFVLQVTMAGLKDKIVMITGASSGIGAGTAGIYSN
jgi:NADP-dependent 3-hydroxy acid dehydrogenase YdfG